MGTVVNKHPALLNSWKEIANYLDRGVRTVQRWERTLQLPVHRIGKGKRAPVYSTTTELKFWIAATPGIGFHRAPQATAGPSQTIEDSRRLLSKVRAVAQSLARNTVRQHRQTEILQARILQMHSRMK